MSFSMRDRPSLRDRLRGKSGDELMEELNRTFFADRRGFDEGGSGEDPKNSQWGGDSRKWTHSSGFPRGFPFDDDFSRGKSTLKEHLADLAQRHPEIADQLSHWRDIDLEIPRNHRQESGPGPKEDSQSESSEAAVGATSEHKTRFIDPTLRNTVPDMQSTHAQNMEKNRDSTGGQGGGVDARGQRSQSAPPEGGLFKDLRTNTDVPHPTHPNNSFSPPPPPGNASHHPSQQNSSANKNQERYIPIFVEGRNETIVNMPQQNSSMPHPNVASTPMPPPPQPQKRDIPLRTSDDTRSEQSISSVDGTPLPAPPPPQQQEPQQQPNSAAPPQPPAPPPSPLDLLAQIHKEVLELQCRIDNFKGSKADKEYMYLDEMLTGKLLKLDNIDSQGKEEIRAARKEIIHLVQLCINTLDSLGKK